jgi:hypothetical protein
MGRCHRCVEPADRTVIDNLLSDVRSCRAPQPQPGRGASCQKAGRVRPRAMEYEIACQNFEPFPLPFVASRCMLRTAHEVTCQSKGRPTIFSDIWMLPLSMPFSNNVTALLNTSRVGMIDSSYNFLPHTLCSAATFTHVARV